MNNKLFMILEFIVILLFIGYFVCRFVFDTKFYIVSRQDYLVAGLILQLILILWKALKKEKINKE